MELKCIFIISLLLSQVVLTAQSSFVFKAQQEINIAHLNSLLNKSKSIAGTKVRAIFPALGLYEVSSNNQMSKTALFKNISTYYPISYIHPNAYITHRTAPNDSHYDDQENMRLIQAENVWELNTGGTTSSGRELVIAIIDDGFDAQHIDLIDNLWSNPGEIIDGIDNDNNGYIDDINGINLSSNDGSHPPLNHGTAVAGIIGARGNNGIGIAGVNWNIKMILLSQGFTLANVIRSYNYIYEQRLLYNQSNGNEGALVVASNFSAGIDFAKASDYPSWCEVYDKLGEVGILNVVAASNQDVDVDVDGDMPSTCPSDYLITVTDSGPDDIFRDTARGKIHIDLSAPGTGTISTRINDFYGGFGFTSGAAPYVCGAIGVLYSLACERIEQEIINSPSILAKAMKEAILLGVEPLDELEDITQSGGRIDIFESAKLLGSYCDESTENSSKLLLYTPSYNNTTTTIKARYRNITNEAHQISLFDMQGRQVYSYRFAPPFLGEKLIQFEYKAKASGIYIMTLSSEKELVSQKIILME